MGVGLVLVVNVSRLGKCGEENIRLRSSLNAAKYREQRSQEGHFCLQKSWGDIEWIKTCGWGSCPFQVTSPACPNRPGWKEI